MSAVAWIGWCLLVIVVVFGMAVGNVWWMGRHLDDQGEEIRDDD